MALARAADSYRVGQLLRVLEHQGALVDCGDPPCALEGACRLAGALNESLQRFYESLDRYTLAELVAPPTGAAIIRLHRAA
ncbi:HTH-type transcriptional repressor nsrR [Bordetella holmesii 70147]|nr:HTH-type transcriptional repressor nsrR [Bordetella holmesii ATCC 51541]EWM49007.1 HTH-type transcriptional repressor nsrR [Bordetella holmesii 70147]